MVKHEAGLEHWMRLFPKQKLMAHIFRFSQSSKSLKGRVNRAVADCNSMKQNVEHGTRFFSTLDTTTCGLFAAPTQIVCETISTTN